MLEMCTEMCADLYNSLISNFVKLHSSNLRLLHIGRQTREANSCMLQLCVCVCVRALARVCERNKGCNQTDF
jgi:hypothetical protein